MTIEATNLQEFDKQYFAYFKDNNVEDTEIELKTTDQFCLEFSKESFDEQMKCLKVLGGMVVGMELTPLNLKRLYSTQYDQVCRIK